MADTWTMLSGYTPYDYVDTMVFEVVSETKKIKPLSGQTLVAGEKNSQYIKFEMDRYWDGIDVSAKEISIVYFLAGAYYGTSEVVSAEVTDSRLRFGWIVPEEACCVSGTLLFVLVLQGTDYILKTQIAETTVVKTIDEDTVIPEPTREAWYKTFREQVQADLNASQADLNASQEALDTAQTAVRVANSTNAELQEAMVVVNSAVEEAKVRYGSPLVAQTAAAMIETNRVYVYTGSESGYTAGNWYYYNGSAWTSGGVYNGTGINTDTTLTQSGMAADAKKTGDEIGGLKSGFNDLYNTAYVTDSASGGVAHFVDGADNVPLKSLKVNIEPVQSGSGDPSPSNVRAITGWDSVKVTRAGKNVFSSKGLTQTLNGITIRSNDDGSFTVNGTATANAQFDLTLNNELKLQSGQYTVGMFADKAVTFNNQNVWWFFYSMDAHAEIVNCQTPSKTFTLSTITSTRFYLRIISGATVDDVTLYPILVYGSDAPTEFEPYNGNTYDVSLSDAGTVYGGTLDVASGELTVDRAIVDLGSLSWGYSEPRFYSGSVTDGITPSSTGDLNAVCEKYALYETGALASQPDLSFFVNSSKMSAGTKRIVIRDSNYTDADNLKSSLNGVHLVYTLATPIIYNLTPTEVKSLLGVNNVWSDAGDVEAEYRADTKLYIDKRLAEVTS